MQSIFEVLFLIGNSGKISKAFQRGNLIFYILETKGCRKLKFGEVGVHNCEDFLRKNRAKNFQPKWPVNSNNMFLKLPNVSK